MKKSGAGRVLKAQTVDLEKQFFYFILLLYCIILLFYCFLRDETMGYINVKCY